MPCFHPLTGFKSAVVGKSGKRAIVFDGRSPRFSALPVSVPCGQCVGCRLERSRQWALRCVHEASLHEANCFLTLTYDEAHLPPFGSLDKRDFCLFMKRFRKEVYPRALRFYHCGEYGGTFGRPHYHALIFGYDFPDKVFFTTRSDLPVWRSDMLGVLWPYGLHEIGSVTFESAAYCARYIMKKLLGKDAVAGYDVYDSSTGEVVARRQPEYTTMSRRPGIGRGWYEKFGREAYAHDSVIINGKEVRPAKYYDKMLEMDDPALWRRIRVLRGEAVDESECTPERLDVREICAQARVNLYA